MEPAKDAPINRRCSLKDKPAKKRSNINAWHELAKLSLAQVVLFNRRRSGETQRITLANYQDLKQDQNEITSSLSEWEQKMCRSFYRLEIRGKRGCKVSLLLTNSMKQNIDLLVEKREAVSIAKKNPYIFARPHFESQTCLRGSDCLRKYPI